MSGEQKFIVVAACLMTICITVLYVILFIALWAYKELVALSLLALLLFAVIVPISTNVLWRFNEAGLRHKRVRYHEELPLTEQGIPLYLPGDAQPNNTARAWGDNFSRSDESRYAYQEGYHPHE